MKLLEQSKNYNCAVYALHFLLGISNLSSDIEDMEKELGTNEDKGTSHEQILDWLKLNNVTGITYGNNSNVHRLSCVLPAIVNYQYWDKDGCDGHYGVVLTVNENKVILYNPAIGEIESVDKYYFEAKWYSERFGKGWFLKINDYNNNLK